MLITCGSASSGYCFAICIAKPPANPSLLIKFSMRRHRPFPTNISDSVFRNPVGIVTRSEMKIDLRLAYRDRDLGVSAKETV